MSSNPHSGPAGTEAFQLRIADISTFDDSRTKGDDRDSYGVVELSVIIWD